MHLRFFKLLLFLSLFFITSCSVVVVTKNVQHKKQFKVCLVGDTGTGSPGQYKVAKAMNESGCSFVIIAGDLIYPFGLQNSKDSQLEEKFLKPYAQMLERDVKFLLIDGNHDTRNLKAVGDNPWFEISKENKNIYFPSMHWKYVINDICIVAFNAKMYRYHTSRMFLRSVDNSKCRYKVAVNHYPYRSTMRHGDAKYLMRHFLKNYIIGSYDVLVAGHDHGLSYEGEHLGTHLIVTGAGAKLRSFKKRSETPFAVKKLGFVLMDISELGIKYDYVDVDNNTLYSISDPVSSKNLEKLNAN